MFQPITQAFVTPSAVTDAWTKLVAAEKHLDLPDEALGALGVPDARALAGRCALLTLDELDAFPALNLGADKDAPTCTTDLPLRSWLKRRLRERGDALVSPMRSFERDVIGNLYLHYLRDGRRDLLRGAGRSDGDLPLGLLDAPRAFGSARVVLAEGFAASLAAHATLGEAATCAGLLDARELETVEATLRARGVLVERWATEG
jgi:hypothetical protein